MAGKTIDMSKLEQIILHRGSGTPLQTIARSLQLSCNTVTKYLRLIEVQKLPAAELLALPDNQLNTLLDDPDPHNQEPLALLIKWFPHFERELKKYRCHVLDPVGEYRRDYPDGFSYSQFCDHFEQYRLAGLRPFTLNMSREISYSWTSRVKSYPLLIR